MTQKEPDQEKVAMFQTRMESTLDTLENIWLDSKTKSYLASEQLSFADLLCACEIEQTRFGGYDPFENRPKLKEWWLRVKEETNPIYDDAHKILYKILNTSKLSKL